MQYNIIHLIWWIWRGKYYKSQACMYIHAYNTQFILTFIALSLLSLIQHATQLLTNTHAYTLVLYETLTEPLAFMDSTPPLSRIIRIASNDPDSAALCSRVSPNYCDMLYIHLLCDNTLILVYTYTINLYHQALQENLYSSYHIALYYISHLMY